MQGSCGQQGSLPMGDSSRRLGRRLLANRRCGVCLLLVVTRYVDRLLGTLLDGTGRLQTRGARPDAMQRTDLRGSWYLSMGYGACFLRVKGMVMELMFVCSTGSIKLQSW